MDAARNSLRASFGSIELIGNDGDADLGYHERQRHGFRYPRRAYRSRSASARSAPRISTRTADDHQLQWIRPSSSRWRGDSFNSFGAVEVGDITGDLVVRNQNGSVNVTNVTGSADIGTSFAGITFLNIKQKLQCRSAKWLCHRQRRWRQRNHPHQFREVDVHDIGGPLEVDDQNAKIIARDIRGGVNLKTSFGSIEAVGYSRRRHHRQQQRFGPSLGYSRRSLTCAPVLIASRRLMCTKALTSSPANASISLTNIGGESYVKTTFGLVKASDIAGPLTVETSNGSVKAENVHGAASVRTSFGSVKLENIFGGVEVNDQNGTVEVSVLPTKNPSGACNAVNLRTSFSPLRVYLDEIAKYDLTAHTSFRKSVQ